MKNKITFVHALYLRNGIAYHDFWYADVKWRYLQAFFFFHIFKILTFCFVRGVKEKKWSKMTKNPVSCPPYPRNHISCDCQIWYTGKMIISPGIFFILSKCWFFGILGGGEAKGQKMAQNDKKLCPLHSISQEPYIICLSFKVHICFFFFSFFKNFDFLGP